MIKSLSICNYIATLAFHLGELKRSYENGLSINCVENFDECHFPIDHDGGRRLKFAGRKNKLLNNCFWWGGITVCLRLSGGETAKLKRLPLSSETLQGTTQHKVWMTTSKEFVIAQKKEDG